MIEHNISTPKPARVKETFTLNNATIFGGRIFHFTGLEDGPLLAIKTGWPKMPDHTAFYHDIHRFDTAEKAGSPRPVPEGPWTNAASSTSIPRWQRSMAARKARRPDITTASTDA